jgi:SsrA-binding protein
MSNVCTNRKAYHDYEVIETIEAGIKLVGTELKPLRDHKVSLEGSYATVEKGELWLINCSIEPQKLIDEIFNHQSQRKRKLLLNKHEIRKFAAKAEQRGNTLIPLKIYFKNGKAKVELAICRGKKEHDKRNKLKTDSMKREMRQEY